MRWRISLSRMLHEWLWVYLAVELEPAGEEGGKASKNEVNVVERQWSSPSCVEWWTATDACSQGGTDYTLHPSFHTDSCQCYDSATMVVC